MQGSAAQQGTPPSSEDAWPLTAAFSSSRVDAVLLVARELSQVPKTSMVEPLYLPSNLLFLFCRYVDRETVNRLDVKME